MFDPISAEALATVLSGILGGTTAAVGESGLEGLKGLVRRARTPSSEVQEQPEMDSVANSSPRLLAAELLDAADREPEFARELHTWFVAQTAGSSVRNEVSGTVVGNVFQMRDVGSITPGK